MEFKILENGNDKFQFVKAYKAYDRGEDIVAYPWKGYMFLINNTACDEMVLRFGDGSVQEIEVTWQLPFLYYTKAVSLDYTFLDEDENEIR